MIRTLLFQTVALLLFPVVLFADARSDLRGVNRAIKEKQQQIKTTGKIENKVSSDLSKIQQQIKDKEASLINLNRDLKNVEANVVTTQAQIDNLTKELDVKNREIALRLSSIYKAGELGELRVFFSSESMPQLVENRRYMKSVLEHDRKLLTDYQNTLAELQVLKQSLEKDARTKEQITQNIKLKKQEIEVVKDQKTKYLAQVKQTKQSYQKSLKDLQANAARLQSMIRKLEARSRRIAIENEKKARKGRPTATTRTYSYPKLSDKGFGAERGRLAKPASGSIISYFGKQKHSEFNAFTFNNGITIAAPNGSDIRSVYEGEVIFASYFKGYGNMIIVDHGGGYFSLYAHASRLFKGVGANVGRNEVIAQVGDTDSTQGPQLYFEIRYQGKPINPIAWIR
ncbi:MAG: peptidoglycan DD-metalloendopeptidase family protein [Desulfuromonadales bacterium]|nr:peptidoglycan DD-metalloendopeptidase family protein [Desulfuromonadales bacterium]